jgi:hypothetical protein
LLDQQVDILAHLLDRLDVVAVLLIDLPFELLDELHFVCDNLRACCLLRLDVLSNKQDSNHIVNKRYDTGRLEA